MNETCLGCYGGRRFSSGGGSYAGGDRNVPVGANNFSRPCDRCHGSGKEPVDELLYVAAMNRRVAARRLKAAA